MFLSSGRSCRFGPIKFNEHDQDLYFHNELQQSIKEETLPWK